jgi:hypothetical protein
MAGNTGSVANNQINHPIPSRQFLPVFVKLAESHCQQVIIPF